MIDVVRRRSPIHGTGIFATHSMRRGRILKIDHGHVGGFNFSHAPNARPIQVWPKVMRTFDRRWRKYRPIFVFTVWKLTRSVRRGEEIVLGREAYTIPRKMCRCVECR